LLRGESLCTQNQCEEAWEEYCFGLIKLAREKGYGHACLRDRLERLQVQLDELPDVQTRHLWCDQFVEAWHRENLAEEFPDLVWMCRDYKEMLDFM
jgi:hypothetical protein